MIFNKNKLKSNIYYKSNIINDIYIIELIIKSRNSSTHFPILHSRSAKSNNSII